MAAVSKAYGVGDTVWVRYPFSGTTTGWAAVSRVVKEVKTTTSGNEATVSFTDGNDVTDGATQRVFTTQALASTAIVDEIISLSAATVEIDATLSGASTASQNAVSLRRSSV